MSSQNSGTRSLRAVLVSHVMLTGCNHALEQYLIPRVESLLAIEHPLENSKPATSEFRLIRMGSTDRSGRKEWSLPEPIRFIMDFVVTLTLVARIQPRSDLFVGLDPLNAFAGILLRLFGRTDYVVFYAIDFSPKRFENPVLNFIYHLGEVLAARFADESWNLAPEMIQARRRLPLLGWVLRSTRGPQKVVPMGANPANQEALARRDRTCLVYMGWLVPKQGLQLVLEALPKLRTRYPGIHLSVIGDGPYKETLQEMVRRSDLEESVTFHGYVDDHAEVEELLAASGVGLAPYLPTEDSFTFYADPGKIKNYLAAQLPIITTAVPPISREIEIRGCGLVVEATPTALKQALELLLSDLGLQTRMAHASARFAREFYWDAVFSKALAKAIVRQG